MPGSGPRIALVTRRYRPLIGGAERVLQQLATELAAQHADVTVVTARWEADWPEREQRDGVAIRRLPVSRRRFLGTWQWMRGVRRWLRENAEAIDLCYASMLKHGAYAAAGAGRRLALPVVVRPEGTGATGDVAWQKRARFGRLIARRLRQADGYVALSPRIEEELRGGGYPADRITAIPNGVPILDAYKPRQRGQFRREIADRLAITIPADASLAVFSGRLSPEKGLPVLLDSWAQVVQSSPDARLILLGDGQLRDDLRRQIAAAGLGERVFLLGAVEDVETYLRAADLFVLPSFEEGMSIALLEAMALGLPVAASDIPGNRVLVEHERHGLLVSPHDADSLASAVVRLATDTAFASRLGTAARARVSREFSVKKMASAHLDLFERLVRKRKEKRRDQGPRGASAVADAPAGGPL